MTSVPDLAKVADSKALDRAYGALIGLAIGDALGMPTQSLTREDVVKEFGELVDDFHAPGPDHPFASGLARATVTDDTEQALLLADALIDSPGDFDARAFALSLLAWEDDVRRRGLLDLLGPSTKRALVNLQAGMDISISGRSGTTNGAAMRVAPVGIVRPSGDLDALVGLVVRVSEPTHNTSEALGAACAVAAVVSAGIDGSSHEEAMATGVRAALLGERLGEPGDAPGVADQIRTAIRLGGAFRGTRLIDRINADIGTSLAAHESVPAAFAVLSAYREDSWAACCIAASLGGDTDTIGAIVGAMAGACAGGGSFTWDARNTVESTNALSLMHVARELLAKRR